MTFGSFHCLLKASKRKLLEGPSLTVNQPSPKTKQKINRTKATFTQLVTGGGCCTQATFTGHQTDRLENLTRLFVLTKPFNISPCSHRFVSGFTAHAQSASLLNPYTLTQLSNYASILCNSAFTMQNGLHRNGVHTTQVKFSTLPGKNCLDKKPILVNKALHKSRLESYNMSNMLARTKLSV